MLKNLRVTQKYFIYIPMTFLTWNVMNELCLFKHNNLSFWIGLFNSMHKPINLISLAAFFIHIINMNPGVPWHVWGPIVQSRNTLNLMQVQHWLLLNAFLDPYQSSKSVTVSDYYKILTGLTGAYNLRFSGCKNFTGLKLWNTVNIQRLLIDATKT